MSRTGCVPGRTSVSEGLERSVAALAPETAMRSRSLRMLSGVGRRVPSWQSPITRRPDGARCREFTLAGWALLSSPRLASVYVGAYVETVPQVTLYIDGETRARMKAAAKAAGVSVSRWVADLIRARTRAEWPASVRELAGAWPDFPTLRQLRSTKAPDTPRESL
jgi:hypothetical protein